MGSLRDRRLHPHLVVNRKWVKVVSRQMTQGRWERFSVPLSGSARGFVLVILGHDDDLASTSAKDRLR